MVERGRSPSPELNKPIQQWEVKALPDAVEMWYKTRTNARNAPVEQSVVQLPPVAEEEKRYALQFAKPATEHDDDSEGIGAAAERLLGESPQPQTPEDQIAEPTYDETIRALRIEEEIIRHNPELAMQLRLNAELWPLNHEGYKLLPHDAPEWLQRRDAHLMAGNLNYLARKMHRGGDPLTTDTIYEYFDKFLRRELPRQQEQDAKQRADGAPELPAPDISLEHVFAFTQRQLLHYYKLSGQNEDMEPYYQASVTVHNLLEGMVSIPATTNSEQ